MLLNEFPPDILVNIGFYLDAQSWVRCVGAGNRRLRVGMSQALDLKLVMPFGAPFPFDAFALPKLRHLSVETVQGLPVALREAPILPSMPLQTLR